MITALVLVGTAVLPSRAAAQQGVRSSTASAAATESAADEGSWFPSGTLFPALAADLKEPRHYASFRRTRFAGHAPPTFRENGEIMAALLGLGTEFGIWGQRNARGDGMQVGLIGGVFTQFDMTTSSPDMLNADYLIGPQFTWRRGDLGLRSRLIHQSSHLGDGLLRRAERLDVEVEHRGPSMEWFDALVFLDGNQVRLYGTARYVLNSTMPLAPWQAAGGVELRARPASLGGVEAEPYAALHVEALEARAWGSTRSAVAGLGFHRAGGRRGIRVAAVYQNGFTPFGKFFTEVRVRSYGIQLEFVP